MLLTSAGSTEDFNHFSLLEVLRIVSLTSAGSTEDCVTNLCW